MSEEARPRLTLAQANRICDGVVAACLSRNFAPVVVVVLDKDGHQIASQRMDGCCPAAYPEFAVAKAYTAVTFKGSSRAFRDKYTSTTDPSKFCQMLSMVNVTGGKMAPFPGGVVIKSAVDGQVVGGVGVSGAAGDEDEYCAIAGVLEAGVEGWNIEPARHALKGI